MSKTLVKVLRNAKSLNDFMILLNALCENKLKPDNIAFLLCLERAKYAYCDNTAKMSYHPMTIKFWKVVYRLLKGKALRLFSGSKHKGQGRDNLNPSTANANFAVPTVHRLRKMPEVNPVPPETKPGIIPSVLEHLSKHPEKDYVIAIDGKKVAQGLSDKYGDIDLWGYETPPISTCQSRLDHELKLIDELTAQEMPPDTPLRELPIQGSQTILTLLKEIATTLTLRLKDIRELELRQHFLQCKLIKFQENNPDVKDKYALPISNVKATKLQCKAVIKTALALTDNICATGSELGEGSHNFNDGTYMDINNQENIVRLKKPKELPAALFDDS